MQNSYSLQCTNCRGITKLEYTGEPIAPNLACKYCGAPLHVPEQLTRAASPDAWRAGLLRALEQAVENAEEVRPGAVSQRASVQVFQAELPRVQASTAKNAGCLIGGISTASCLLTLFIIVTAAIPLLAVGLSMGSVSDVFDSVSRQINNAAGTRTIEARRSLQGLDLQTDQIVYSPDGRLLAASASDQIILWDVQSGAKVTEIEQSFSSDALFFTHDSQQLVTNDGSNMVFYTSQDGRILRQFECRCNSFALSPDDSTIFFKNYDDQVRLVSAADGTLIRDLGTITFYTSHLLFSPDGRFVVAGSSGSELAAWDVTTGQQIFNGNSNATSTDLIAFHPHQNTLVIGRDNTLEFYEVGDTGLRFARSQKIEESFFSIQGIAYSPDGTEIAMGNFFDDVWVWNVEEKRITKKLKSDTGIRAVAYSPDGAYVIGSGSRGDLIEWQIGKPSGGGSIPPAARTNTPLMIDATRCAIFPNGQTAPIRSGPGTDYPISGTLSGAVTVSVQRSGSDGFRWWKLDDGRGWVREDVVSEVGGCDTLPQE